jgi:uncharacterized protein YegP (UPF0339 family)
MARSTILVYEEARGWRFRLVAGHEAVATSQTLYGSKASAVNGARAFQRHACEATIREIASRPGESATPQDTRMEESAA